MNFLINTFTAWNEPPRCRHQVAIELAKRYNVLFVEQNKLGIPRLQVIHESERLARIIPYWPLDYRLRYRIPLLNELFQEYLFRKIKELFFYGKIKEWKIINFDFTATRLVKHFTPDSIIYYCNDDFIGNADFSPLIINKYHQCLEKTVIKNSGCCIATSDFLYKKMSCINMNTHLIHLGAPSGIPDEYKVYRNNNKNEDKIIVAYVGFMLPNKLAIDWIQECLGNTRIEFVLIGPGDKEVTQHFTNSSNVKFLGVKTGTDLYSSLSNANVCIAPYNLRKINRGVTPNKLWLYLALGKPVVLTKLPNIASGEFEDDIIYQTEDKQDFPHLIEKAFHSDTEELFLKRIELSQKNSWSRKIDQFLEILL